MLDNRHPFETPEGSDILLTPAGIGVRTLAFFIDLLIRGTILLAASLILQLSGKLGIGIFFMILFIVEWFYPVIFEIYQGATPGKKLYGLAVIYDNGLPVTLPGSLLRNLFRSIDILPFAYLAGFVSIMCSERFKRLGDYIAGTMVIYQAPSLTIKQLQLQESTSEPLHLSLAEQQAVIAFAERSEHLSEQRQLELANYLSDFLGCSDKEAVIKLKSMASNLLGKS